MGSLPTAPVSAGTSTRPYLLRALHDWCTDNGFTPYIAVFVDASVQVPTEYVKNNEIVLNVGFEATSALKLGNEFIEFKARFGGTSREIIVPVDHVIAIYARENGQGMAFPMPTDAGAAPADGEAAAPAKPVARGPRLARSDGEATAPEGDAGGEDEPPPEPPTPGRPALKRVK
ncbi:ClpXP protease specificity-enhancing factor [Piscinibacter koreensis]|uniref:ClpXP protease specificity-enhancing factor n=1 Tax=Piscinibacter koreensis TaxID=2742824 RepID=A0A7Y6NMA0_9BURK|nr:ClpXP protease specificity-enhancing factor [Schlegelella koreensis]NUZ05741.1 ClpXP protease specificity-enhancing factor [Schlegelella koreensis]